MSIRSSVGLSIPRYFQKSKIEVFECGKSSNVMIMLNNDTISDDEVVASYVTPRYLLEPIDIGHENRFFLTQ